MNIPKAALFTYVFSTVYIYLYKYICILYINPKYVYLNVSLAHCVRSGKVVGLNPREHICSTDKNCILNAESLG